MAPFAIHSNQTVLDDDIKDTTVIISDGRIKNIIEGMVWDFAGEIIDVGNKVLMPGIIDPHVHINEPGHTDWEGFHTATRAAIAGGITMLVDMPLNSLPVTTTVAALDEKINAAKNQLHTNCGFWGGIIPGNEKEIEPLIEKGVLGFKAFLIHSGINEFPNVTREDLRTAMPVIAKYNLPLLVHCELSTSQQPGATHQRQSYNEYLSSRPRQWEDSAIAMMIRLCEEFNCRTHIVHLSSSDSIDQIAKAKQKGLPLTVETAQHYLYFNAEQIKDKQTLFKCAPPIREKENNQQLWQALKDGIIDFVATDHSPAPPALKEIHSGNFTEAWGGISSLQFSLPVLWTVAKGHGGSLNDMARWLSEKPAILTGKQNIKGKIKKGYDADFVVWNPQKEFFITKETIHHKHKITPYFNEQLYGVAEQTWLNGKKVYDSGSFNKLNSGQIILGNG